MSAADVFYPRCLVVASTVFDGRHRGSDPLLEILARPRAATITLNGYHEADTFSLEFDGRAHPFDPALFRSVAVGIYLFDAGSLAHSELGTVPGNRRIVGLVDDPHLLLSDEGQTVTWEGRDYTALLLDIEWDPSKRVPMGRRLSETVELLAAEVGPKRFRVVYDSDTADPIVGAAFRASMQRGRPVSPGKTLWDVIYELCTQLGFIVFVDGETIVITEPRIQTAASAAQSPVLVYGRNLAELASGRRLGKERVPQIVAVSRDPRTGRVLRAVFPTKHQSPITGVGTKRDERMRVTAPAGIKDEATLRRFARTYYENLARTEAVYRFRTRHLRAPIGDGSGGGGGDGRKQDLCALKPGTPIRLAFDAFNRENLRQLSAPQRSQHLRAMGYSAAVADFVAEHFDDLAQFRQPYYLRHVTLHFSDQDGVEIEGEAVNYAFVPREEAAA